MFDFVFDVFVAWNSIGLFIMAFVLILIGGGLTAYELVWLIRGKRIQGRIKEVRVVGKKDNEDERAEQPKESEAKEDEASLTKDLKKKPVFGGGSFLFVLLFMSIPIIFTGFGVYTGYKYVYLTQNGEYAQAKVVRNESSRDSEGGISYKAVLSFRDYNGVMHEVRDGLSYGSSPSFSVGTTLGVYYDANKPKTFVIDDFWHNMALSFGFMLVFPLLYLILRVASFFQNKQKASSQQSKSGAKKSFTNETYYTVYEYKMPNGERREQVSDLGSSQMGKNIPGRRVSVLISPHNPEKMKRPHFALLFFGLVFLVPGLFILNQAIQTVEFNYMMIVLPFALFAFIVVKIGMFIARIPKKEWNEGMSAFKEAKKEGFSVRSSGGGSSENARVLSMSDMRERMRAMIKNYTIGGYVCLLIALGLAGGSYYLGADMVDKLRSGVPTQGEVVDFESRYSRSSEGSGYTYYSVVEFTDDAGRLVRFRDRVGSSHRMNKRGDVVDVLYAPNNPVDAMIDRGIWNWVISGGLALGAFLLLFAAMDNFKTARLYGGGGHRTHI